MDTKHPHEPPAASADLHHEVSDVSARPIAWFGVSLAVLVLVSLVLMKGLFVFFERQAELQDTKPTGVMLNRPSEPPQPRLQTNPVLAMKAILANENALLESYGWLNEKMGSVRIPVRRAMELLAERGLPARAANETVQPAVTPSQGENHDNSLTKAGDGQAVREKARH